MFLNIRSSKKHTLHKLADLSLQSSRVVVRPHFVLKGSVQRTLMPCNRQPSTIAMAFTCFSIDAFLREYYVPLLKQKRKILQQHLKKYFVKRS